MAPPAKADASILRVGSDGSSSQLSLRRVMVLVGILLALSACGHSGSSATQPSMTAAPIGELIGSWRLTARVGAGETTERGFIDGGVKFHSGVGVLLTTIGLCPRISGNVSVLRDHQMRLSRVTMNLMGCPEEYAQQNEALRALFYDSAELRPFVDSTGTIMHLRASGGAVYVFERVPAN